MKQITLIFVPPEPDAVEITVKANETELLRPIIASFMDSGLAASRAHAEKVRQILLNTGRWPFPSGVPKFYCARENWPWHDASSGAIIQPNRFYGFSDSGGLTGVFNGYETLEEATQDIVHEYGQDTEWLGFTVGELGQSPTAVLTGRDFMNALYALHARSPEGFSFEQIIASYGQWSLED